MAAPPPFPLRDQLGRTLRDLRISVTDRCNLRCTYCMPREVFGADYPFLPRPELLTFEEITRLAGLFARLGVVKLRLTGGEPLLRQDLPVLVGQLAHIPGIRDIAMTTNGLLLPRYAADLKAAGLRRVTVSLDSLDPDVFGQMNGLGVSPQRVLEGIEAALSAGLGVKVNTVVQRGVNDAGLPELWQAVRGLAQVRFIEFMDVGNHNGWALRQVLPSAQLRGQLQQAEPQLPWQALTPAHSSDVARTYQAGSYQAGFISSVSEPFCGDCSRARLSAVGSVYTCLFATGGHDLRGPLRSGASDDQLTDHITTLWQDRRDRYSEERAAVKHPSNSVTKIEMSHIGG